MRVCKFISIGLIVLGQCLSAQTNVPPVSDSMTAVSYAHAAEIDPLTQTAAMKRKEAMRFTANDHSVHVTLCFQLAQKFYGNQAANAHEITQQYLISSSAYLYEHPDASGEPVAQNLAGVEAALNVYEKFLATDRKTYSKFLDSLDQDRGGNNLKKHVSGMCIQPTKN